MKRVGGRAQRIRDRGPTDNVAIAVRPPKTAAPAFPHARHSQDAATVPAVTGTYVGPWLTDLKTLARRAGMSFTSDPLKRLGLG